MTEQPKHNENTNIVIRPETESDQPQIRRVTIDAFTNCEFGHNGEADLVDTVRRCGTQNLSLVAVQADVIVGHALFTPVVIRGKSPEETGMGLAPMSVATEHQRTGIGSLLMNTGLEQLRNSGCRFVVVLGHPDYYTKFGFAAATDYGVTHGFDGIPQDFFFVKFRMQNDRSDHPGTAFYLPEFGPQKAPDNVT